MSKRNTLVDLSRVTHDDIVYLAGLIDGDGCFFISERKKRDGRLTQSYGMNLNIHCITKSLIDSIEEVFGGIRYINRKKPPRLPLYGIEFTGNRLKQIIEMILPYLRLKKPNALNMLRMRNTYDGKGGRYIDVPDEILQIRHECYLRSRELNTHKPLPKDTNLAPCCPSALSSEEFQVN